MNDWVELVWFLAVLFLALWVRKLSNRLDVVKDALVVVARGLENIERDVDWLATTDAYRSLKSAADDEDWTRDAILKLRQRGKFDAVQKLEEMEHQVRCGVGANIFRHFFRGIGWIPE